MAWVRMCGGGSAIPSKLEIIKNGVVSTLLASLKTSTDRTVNYQSLSGKQPTVSYSNSQIVVTMASGSSGVVYSERAIDLSNYSKLEVTFSFNGTEQFWKNDIFFVANKGNNIFLSGELIWGQSTNNPYSALVKRTFDISSLVGCYYLCISLARTSTVVITDINLIK